MSCRERNTNESQASEEEDLAGDASGLVGNYMGEFLCPICRRVSNALLPDFDVEEQAQPTTAPLQNRGVKRKANTGEQYYCKRQLGLRQAMNIVIDKQG